MSSLKHILALVILTVFLANNGCGREEAETDNTPVGTADIGVDYRNIILGKGDLGEIKYVKTSTFPSPKPEQYFKK